MVNIMSDMVMGEIRCPFCNSAKGVDEVDVLRCEACDKCDEYGMIGITYDDASVVWTLQSIALQAAREEIRGIVVVVEKGDGSIEQYQGGYIVRSKGSDALEQIAKSARKVWATENGDGH